MHLSIMYNNYLHANWPPCYIHGRTPLTLRSWYSVSLCPCTLVGELCMPRFIKCWILLISPHSPSWLKTLIGALHFSCKFSLNKGKKLIEDCIFSDILVNVEWNQSKSLQTMTNHWAMFLLYKQTNGKLCSCNIILHFETV